MQLRVKKEIKGWLRAKKRDLIKANNPELKDLAEDWYKG
jgi:predicted GIY-YIG superfamily endonuclease